MKGIVVGVITFALVIGLVISVFMPIINKGKSTGQDALASQTTIDTAIAAVAAP